MNHDAQGFTLVELMVSMTLLALLMVLLFGGLRFGTRAWERSSVIGDTTDEVRSVQGYLRNALERICPRRNAVTEPAVPTVTFSGTSNTIEFLAPEAQAAGSDSCASLTLGTFRYGAQMRLAIVMADSAPRTLLMPIKDVAFAYLGNGAWHDSWSRQANLPDLIRIRVSFPSADAHTWPEFYVTPRISAENDCVYSPQTKTCQGS